MFQMLSKSSHSDEGDRPGCPSASLFSARALFSWFPQGCGLRSHLWVAHRVSAQSCPESNMLKAELPPLSLSQSVAPSCPSQEPRVLLGSSHHFPLDPAHQVQTFNSLMLPNPPLLPSLPPLSPVIGIQPSAGLLSPMAPDSLPEKSKCLPMAP